MKGIWGGWNYAAWSDGARSLGLSQKKKKMCRFQIEFFVFNPFKFVTCFLSHENARNHWISRFPFCAKRLQIYFLKNKPNHCQHFPLHLGGDSLKSNLWFLDTWAHKIVVQPRWKKKEKVELCRQKRGFWRPMIQGGERRWGKCRILTN